MYLGGISFLEQRNNLFYSSINSSILVRSSVLILTIFVLFYIDYRTDTCISNKKWSLTPSPINPHKNPHENLRPLRPPHSYQS